MFLGYDARRQLKSPLVQQKVPVLQSLANAAQDFHTLFTNPVAGAAQSIFFAVLALSQFTYYK